MIDFERQYLSLDRNLFQAFRVAYHAEDFQWGPGRSAVWALAVEEVVLMAPA